MINQKSTFYFGVIKGNVNEDQKGEFKIFSDYGDDSNNLLAGLENNLKFIEFVTQFDPFMIFIIQSFTYPNTKIEKILLLYNEVVYMFDV